MNFRILILPVILPGLLHSGSLTPFSGNLIKRPILMVHGINADMGSWGAQRAELLCETPKATFLDYVYQYIPIFGAHLDKTQYDLRTLQDWNPSGTTMPVPVLNAPGQIWRDFPTDQAYFKIGSSSGGGALSKSSSTQAAAALPPSWAFQDPVNKPDMMQVVVGFKYQITCKDGYNFVDATGIHFGTNGQYAVDYMAAFLEQKWNNFPYKIAPDAWYKGYVKSYRAGSGAAVLAEKYGLSTAKSATSGYTDGINHNGLEFYTSTDPSHLNPDPFCRPDSTKGVVPNAILHKDEIGQTNQLLDRMQMVLDEYYPDWKTNPSRRFDVVCHSQGCLVTRNAIRTSRSTNWDNPINHLNHVISLNSPALGTAIATDKSGVPVIEETREKVYWLYRSKLLDPIRIKVPIGIVDFSIKIWDPFKDIRQSLSNFTNTDHYLAYPDDYKTPNWEPPTSQIGVGSGTCRNPSVTYTGTTVKSGESALPLSGQVVFFHYNIVCEDGHVETTSRISVNYSLPTSGAKPAPEDPNSLIPGIKDAYDGAKYGDYGLRSPFMTSLVQASPVFPTRPADGTKIAFTVYYGVVPGFGTTLINKIIANAQAACADAFNWQEEVKESEAKASLISNGPLNLVVPVITDAVTATASIPFNSCENFLTTVNTLLQPMFTALDQNWSQYSDFVVDKSSQKMQGLFGSWDPFKVREYSLQPGELGVPHMDFGLVGPNGGILRGACAHGEDYFNALENPPPIGLFSSVFSLLLN